jgi:hypothetical protein
MGTKHTPGRWDHVIDQSPHCRDDDRLNVIGPNGELIATLNRHAPGVVRLSTGHEVEAPGCGGDPEANARLIAASPELLVACKAALEEIEPRRAVEASAEDMMTPRLRRLSSLVTQLKNIITKAGG